MLSTCQELDASQGGAPGKDGSRFTFFKETLLNLQFLKKKKKGYTDYTILQKCSQCQSSNILHFVNVLLTTVFENNVSQTLKIFFYHW